MLIFSVSFQFFQTTAPKRRVYLVAAGLPVMKQCAAHDDKAQDSPRFSPGLTNPPLPFISLTRPSPALLKLLPLH